MAEGRQADVDLVNQGAAGVAELFSRHREQLQRAVRFRLDPRLTARVDCEDVLQEAYLEISRRAADYASSPTVPFFIWARQITLQVLIGIQRKHLGATKRDVKLEVSLPKATWSRRTSSDLASQLAGDLTSPSEAAVREEAVSELRQALEGMNEVDREVLVLRHLEELSNKEVAEVLGLNKSAASQRYVRALERLKETLSKLGRH